MDERAGDGLGKADARLGDDPGERSAYGDAEQSRSTAEGTFAREEQEARGGSRSYGEDCGHDARHEHDDEACGYGPGSQDDCPHGHIEGNDNGDCREYQRHPQRGPDEKQGPEEDAELVMRLEGQAGGQPACYR